MARKLEEIQPEDLGENLNVESQEAREEKFETYLNSFGSERYERRKNSIDISYKKVVQCSLNDWVEEFKDKLKINSEEQKEMEKERKKREKEREIKEKDGEKKKEQKKKTDLETSGSEWTVDKFKEYKETSKSGWIM